MAMKSYRISQGAQWTSVRVEHLFEQLLIWSKGRKEREWLECEFTALKKHVWISRLYSTFGLGLSKHIPNKPHDMLRFEPSMITFRKRNSQSKL
jgi:hypothetical protein